MFVITLKFSNNKEQAGQYMNAHNDWIKQGFEDGIFLIVGSLQTNLGGAVIAHNTTYSELLKRVNTDPFINKDIVKAEILEITPSRTDERLDFLLNHEVG